jgi:hypothetical protein
MGGVLLLVKEKKEPPEGDDDGDDSDDDVITGISTPEERSELETKTRNRELVRTLKVMQIVSHFRLRRSRLMHPHAYQCICIPSYVPLSNVMISGTPWNYSKHCSCGVHRACDLPTCRNSYNNVTWFPSCS